MRVQYALAAVALIALQGSALADCLQEKVIISKATVKTEDWGKSIAFAVTNNLKWPISFVSIKYEVVSKGRAVPWDATVFGMDIQGGIEPGETRTVRTTLSLPSDVPEELEARGAIVDVADASRRQLIGKPRYAGNSKELSPLACE